MEQNVGNADRLLRFFLGAAVISFVFFWPQTAWGYLGLIAVLSSLSGFCPLYGILGVRTCPVNRK
jgi:hypothetical protein